MGKKDESGMLDMLMSAVSEAKNGSSKQEEFSNSDAEKQHEEWAKKIKEANSFDVGDKVVRNRFGQRKYNKPLEGQYAVIRHVFNEYRVSPDDGMGVNAVISIQLGDGIAINVSVDLAMFDKYKGK